jgi:hypothetical protein
MESFVSSEIFMEVLSKPLQQSTIGEVYKSCNLLVSVELSGFSSVEKMPASTKIAHRHPISRYFLSISSSAIFSGGILKTKSKVILSLIRKISVSKLKSIYTLHDYDYILIHFFIFPVNNASFEFT